MYGTRIVARFGRLLSSLPLLWITLQLPLSAVSALEIGSYRPMIGAEDPLIQGWGPHNVGFQVPAPHTATIVPGPDAGRLALNLHDDDPATNNPAYSQMLMCGDPCVPDLARENGWRLSAKARLVDDFGSTYGGMGLGTWLDNRAFYLVFDLEEGDLRATWMDGTGGDSAVMTTSVLTTDGVGATDYHTFALSFDPATETVSVTFDGEFQATTLGIETMDVENSFEFGNFWPNALGSMDFYEVRYETLSPMTEVDFNDNHVVDAADYTVWRDHFGQASTLADANGNGHVDRQDYTMWKENYGRIAPDQHASGLAAAVPEAGTAVLLALGLTVWWASRPCYRKRFVC